MADLKLGRLPDRTPVKLALSLPPELYARLGEYAAAYAAAYGKEEPVTELVPAMLTAFLDSDRGFAKARPPGR
ncbi:transposase [Sphingomonas sp. Leaf24]|uniref:DUF2274 domain-containing protein n=1 Tax=unclassified Sphingomonas TaxID=196159 RepID=UPI0007005776|nr:MULTISPECIES: DUF2274 domain-containing protein [unclassified Sphingomonas]KQM17300.1 transposase [Sphingomonas sp. Leaf5]KQM88192.1 transposase [Sphingomonas sp. Leaf24]